MDINFYLFQIINSWAGQDICLDGLAIFFARYFEYVLAFCLLLFLIKNSKKYWPMIWQAILAGIVSRFIFTEIIRWLLPVNRPFVENQVNLLFNYPAQPSFPSGHAAFYFALSAVVFSYNKKAGSLFFVASFLICFSRVFCGIHWPLDILAGAILGIFTAWLIIKKCRGWESNPHGLASRGF